MKMGVAHYVDDPCPIAVSTIIPSAARLYLHSIELFVVVVRRRQKGALGSFSLTVHATDTKRTAVLYHIIDIYVYIYYL